MFASKFEWGDIAPSLSSGKIGDFELLRAVPF